MMYLEDYLESIEDLPVTFKDMLVTVRELDLVVQNAMDTKTKEFEEFFQKAERMEPDRRESVFQSLKTDFAKILDDSNEKINVVEKLQHMLMNSVRQLDRELARFKIHLETDNPGITSLIEQKVAKSEVSVEEGSGKTRTQKIQEFIQEDNPGIASSIEERVAKIEIAVQEGSDKTVTQNRKKLRKRSRKQSSASSSTSTSVDEVPEMKPTPILDSVQEKENIVNNAAVTLNVGDTLLPGVELTYDPTPYCICNQVSYGEMIACDNPSCPHEWFHYPCVNLMAAPEGTWYCPRCNVAEVSLKRK